MKRNLYHYVIRFRNLKEKQDKIFSSYILSTSEDSARGYIIKDYLDVTKYRINQFLIDKVDMEWVKEQLCLCDMPELKVAPKEPQHWEI